MPSNQHHAPQVRTSLSDSDKHKLDKIKLYKSQCEDILRRHSAITAQGSHVLQAERDRLRLIDFRIHEKIKLWSKWDAINTFVQHEAMKSDLQDLHRRLDAAMAPMIDFVEANEERSKGQGAKDSQELRALTCSIFKSTQDLAELANMLMDNKRRKDAEDIMKFAQLQLMEPNLRRDEVTTYQEGLYYLYDKTQILPPLATLNGQVILKSHDLTGRGSGRFLNRKPVLLQPLPRALARYKNLREKFEEEVLKWRKLDHHNLVPAYGIIDLGSDVYLVSPWTTQGTLLQFADANGGSIDNLKCLIEVATGLDFLHKEGIIHGSLYASNIFVSQDGRACVSYYGITSFLEQHGSGLVDMTEISDYRRSAPEVTIDRHPLSTASDTWSFGMLALELLTGKQPFDDISPDIWVLSHLERLKHLSCKLSEYIASGLPIDIRRFLDECLNYDSSRRMSVDVLSMLKRTNRSLQGSLVSSRVQSTTTLPSTDDDASDTSERSSERNLNLVSRPSDSTPMWASAIYTESSVSLSPLSIQFNEQDAIPEEDGGQPSDNLAILLGPSRPTHTIHRLPRLTVALTPPRARQPSATSSLHQQLDGPAPVRQGSQSTTSALPPPTPPKPLASIPADPSPSNPTVSPRMPERPGTSGSGLSRVLETMVSPTSACGSGSVFPNASTGRFSQMHERIANAFGTPELIEFQHALSEACSYVKDIRYRYLASATHLQFTDASDIQYQVFRDVILSLSKPHPSFLEAYMPTLRRLCEVLQAQNLSSKHQDKPSDLLVYMDKRPDFQLARVPGPSGNPGSLSAVELAQALSFLQAEKYRAIERSSDYLDHLIFDGSSSSIKDALNTHIAIMLWAQDYVLSHNTLQKRFYAVHDLLAVAEECKNIANFASMFAIGEALHDPNISELPKLPQLLNGNSSVKKQLKKLHKDGYQDRVNKSTGNNYLPCLRYLIDRFKPQTDTPKFLSLYEINSLLENVQRQLCSLPAAKAYQEGEKFIVHINSLLKSFGPEGVEGHKSKFEQRHAELKIEEMRPGAVAEGKRILETFRGGHREIVFRI
ncbi:hypothetical protein BJ165DRAFT_1524467 [Panaeolus papilionaceus]|nr:hypothetical protein BJ165DRAFT_1524467 [Panaeolus papilionaceus]